MVSGGVGCTQAGPPTAPPHPGHLRPREPLAEEPLLRHLGAEADRLAVPEERRRLLRAAEQAGEQGPRVGAPQALPLLGQQQLQLVAALPLGGGEAEHPPAAPPALPPQAPPPPALLPEPAQ